MNKFKLKKENWLLLDGSYLTHRSMRAPGLKDLKTEDGRQTSGVYGVYKSLSLALEKYPDYYPIIIMDLGLSKRRLGLDNNYKKANDKATINLDGLTEEELKVHQEGIEYRDAYRNNKTYISEIAQSLGIPYLEFDGVEGDDIGAVLATHLPGKKVLVTSDSDWVQIVSLSDHDITLWRPHTNEEVTQCNHADFVMVKALTGDGSDNIPQIAFKNGVKSCENYVAVARAHGFNNDDIVNKPLEFLEVLKKDMKLSKALEGFIEAVEIYPHRLRVNLNLVDLGRISEEEKTNILSQSMQHLADISEGVNLFDAIKAFGKYGINSVDVPTLISKLKGMRACQA